MPNLTQLQIDKLECPPSKSQTFLADDKTPGLKVRATQLGSKSFIFESRLHRRNFRITIGNVLHWSIQDARQKAAEYRVLVDQGIDPRQKKKAIAAHRKEPPPRHDRVRTTEGVLGSISERSQTALERFTLSRPLRHGKAIR